MCAQTSEIQKFLTFWFIDSFNFAQKGIWNVNWKFFISFEVFAMHQSFLFITFSLQLINNMVRFFRLLFFSFNSKGFNSLLLNFCFIQRRNYGNKLQWTRYPVRVIVNALFPKSPNLILYSFAHLYIHLDKYCAFSGLFRSHFILWKFQSISYFLTFFQFN